MPIISAPGESKVVGLQIWAQPEHQQFSKTMSQNLKKHWGRNLVNRL